MTTIEISTPGSDQDPVVTTPEGMSAAVRALRGGDRFTFQVYGTEFCRALGAVALFQAPPKVFPTYAAVRCLSRHDGLSMAALNGSAAAAGNVSTMEPQGYGAFSIPFGQVKALLAVFKVTLPKGVSAQEYVLEVEVADRQMTVTDVSGLIDGSSLTVEVAEDPASREHGDSSTFDPVQQTFQVLQRGLDEVAGADRTAGIYFSAEQVGRMARAADLLGVELHLRMNGRMLVAPLADDFIAYCASGEHREDDEHRPPWIDQRSLAAWRGRLDEVIDQGVI